MLCGYFINIHFFHFNVGFDHFYLYFNGHSSFVMVITGDLLLGEGFKL